uniref:(northern house mosquito) hypothetical protein n=1 Tax=Culex pipiens TaxID=7175 RepID=A0A8D8JGI2_CULPI
MRSPLIRTRDHGYTIDLPSRRTLAASPDRPECSFRRTICSCQSPRTRTLRSCCCRSFCSSCCPPRRPDQPWCARPSRVGVGPAWSLATPGTWADSSHRQGTPAAL